MFFQPERANDDIYFPGKIPDPRGKAHAHASAQDGIKTAFTPGDQKPKGENCTVWDLLQPFILNSFAQEALFTARDLRTDYDCADPGSRRIRPAMGPSLLPGLASLRAGELHETLEG